MLLDLLRFGARLSRVGLCFLWATAVLCVPVQEVSAQTGALIVRNDRGGIVGTRARQIAQLDAIGRSVEIRGDICLSSCTMYLGADDVCVHPKTRFGFHGPSYYGRPLPPKYFDYWSEVIAEHYPSVLKDWFLNTARHRIRGYHTVRGSELIRLGVKQCKTAHREGRP